MAGTSPELNTLFSDALAARSLAPAAAERLGQGLEALVQLAQEAATVVAEGAGHGV